MKRESGYYWVQYFGHDDWRIELYDAGAKSWIISKRGYEYDTYFDFINEQRILTTDEN